MNSNAWLERTQLLIKEEGIEQLQQSCVLIVGMGGVGSFAAEFIVRSGIGEIIIVDGDTVDTTNRNRQLPALSSTIGQSKVQLMKKRLLDINPTLKIDAVEQFLSPGAMEALISQEKINYVMDCIDSISPKLALIATAKKYRKPIISAMGAGGKLDPSKITIRDISNTSECLLARNIRKRLKKMHIHNGVRCVFSTEKVISESLALTDGRNFKKSYYGTISYMPALFGLYAASEVIRNFIKPRLRISLSNERK